MTDVNVMAMKNEAMCNGYIKEVNFRDTGKQFVYKGKRGIAMVDKGDDEAEAYAAFIAKLDAEFGAAHIYHQFGNHRFEVPTGMDRAEAEVFLDIITQTTEQLNAVKAA